MITNLFSSFDPSTNIFFLKLSLNWLSRLFIILIFPIFFWTIPNNLNFIFSSLIKILYNEFYNIINKNKFNNFNLIFISIFLLIIINNFITLFPYIFTNTSHIAINLRFSIPIWLRIILYGWIKKTNNIFKHLVPQRTPNILIPFIILIERIRLLIRPITLIVRLTANIIAGHLLLTLLRNSISNLNYLFTSSILLIQIILLTLESAVSIIQSYVFAILITLYVREIS